MLKAQLEAAEAKYQDARGQARKAEERERIKRERADRLMQIVKRQTLMLEHRQSVAAPAPAAPPPVPEAAAAAPAPAPMSPPPEPAKSSDDAAARLAAIWRQATEEREAAARTAKRQRKH